MRHLLFKALIMGSFLQYLRSSHGGKDKKRVLFPKSTPMVVGVHHSPFVDVANLKCFTKLDHWRLLYLHRKPGHLQISWEARNNQTTTRMKKMNQLSSLLLSSLILAIPATTMDMARIPAPSTWAFSSTTMTPIYNDQNIAHLRNLQDLSSECETSYNNLLQNQALTAAATNRTQEFEKIDPNTYCTIDSHGEEAYCDYDLCKKFCFLCIVSCNWTNSKGV